MFYSIHKYNVNDITPFNVKLNNYCTEKLINQKRALTLYVSFPCQNIKKQRSTYGLLVNLKNKLLLLLLKKIGNARPGEGD